MHEEAVTAVTFSSDDALVATASHESKNGANTLRLWDTATGKPVGQSFVFQKSAERPASPIERIVFSPDSKLVATTCLDKTMLLWTVPRPVEGTPERLNLWINLVTGMELDPGNAPRDLDVATWNERRGRLEELGGPSAR